MKCGIIHLNRHLIKLDAPKRIEFSSVLVTLLNEPYDSCKHPRTRI